MVRILQHIRSQRLMYYTVFNLTTDGKTSETLWEWRERYTVIQNLVVNKFNGLRLAKTKI